MALLLVLQRYHDLLAPQPSSFPGHLKREWAHLERLADPAVLVTELPVSIEGNEVPAASGHRVRHPRRRTPRLSPAIRRHA
jgi:hypothetical protein